MKRLVAFFEIPAIDFDRTVKFYESILNVKLSVMESQVEKMAFFPEESGYCPGAISLADDFKPSKDGTLISLNVGDMEEAICCIQKNGGEIITPKTKIESDRMGYFSIFKDTEGNRVGLYSER